MALRVCVEPQEMQKARYFLAQQEELSDEDLLERLSSADRRWW